MDTSDKTSYNLHNSEDNYTRIRTNQREGNNYLLKKSNYEDQNEITRSQYNESIALNKIGDAMPEKPKIRNSLLSNYSDENSMQGHIPISSLVSSQNYQKDVYSF